MVGSYALIAVSTTIGIKIADRTYYPILEKGAPSKKRLVLTTVKDDQRSVQIDLYENEESEMSTARYVGSMLIENINTAPKGDVEVDLVVGLDESDTLSANAHEDSSGDSQSLSVSLETLAEDKIYDIPEFEMDDDLDTWDEESPAFDELAQDELAQDEPAEDDEFDTVGAAEQEAIVVRRRPIFLWLFIVLAVSSVVIVAMLFFKVFQGSKVPPLQANNESTFESAENVQTGGGPAVATASDSDAKIADPEERESEGSDAADDSEVAAQTEPEAIPRAAPQAVPQAVPQMIKSDDLLGGSWYWIRWGDTLWHLSSSFYQNPWLYKVIAEQNQIKDPDTIYAGSKIYIPSR